MGQDCLWDGEEQHREWTAQLICSSFMSGTRLPLGQRGAIQRIDCTADLLLHSLWDKTASGTGRSKMLVILTLLSKKTLKKILNKGWIMAQYLIHVSTCLYVGPLGQEELDHQKGAPRCSRGSLVPEWRKEQISCAVYPLFCSSLLERQSRPIMKGGANQLWSPISMLLLTFPEAVLSHTEARRISFTRS